MLLAHRRQEGEQRCRQQIDRPFLLLRAQEEVAMAAATPEVPNETEMSPTLMPSPRDAMALSPPPGAMMQPPSTFLPAIFGLTLTAATSRAPWPAAP